MALRRISAEQNGIVDDRRLTTAVQASAEADVPQALPDRGDDPLAVSDPDADPPDGRLADMLSPRELEVLTGIATGATNGEIAQRLFIAPSTVKTHVERIMVKLGVRSRTEAAVRYARWSERQRSPDEDRTRKGGGRSTDASVGGLAEAYKQGMRVGDPAAALAVIDAGLAVGLSAVAIQSRVMAPAMREIGSLWERGVVTVAEEHLATAVSHRVLTRLYPGLLRRARRDGDTVVVAAVQGEHHVLGLRMVADVFEGNGFDVRFLGADVPVSSLTSWVQEHRPSAVALGVTMPLGVSTLARQVVALRECDPDLQVIIGGQGVPAVLRQGAGVVFLPDTEQLAEHLKGSLHRQVVGELPPGIERGGVAFSWPGGATTSSGEALVQRLAQTTVATADAARGQARRAFVLEQLAFRDPLTELWNRRAFEDRYQALTAAGDLRAPTILMIDVDHFKSVNDRLGHRAGDAVLVGVARLITGALRPGDLAARYGGDEFVVLLPDASAGQAAEMGERIRDDVSCRHAGPQITVSIGVCVPKHGDRRRATLEVDRALYEAKERGRNQVAFA